MKLAEIASTVGARLENGSPETEITGVAGIEEAGPGQVTFVANPKYAAAARTTKAAAVIVAEDFPAVPAAMLRSGNPYLAFAKAIGLFHQPTKYAAGVHPTAVVHASARIGAGAHVGPYVVIGEDVVIGKNAVLLAHVVIYRGVRIGDNFFAHAHAVVREGCRLGDCLPVGIRHHDVVFVLIVADCGRRARYRVAVGRGTRDRDSRRLPHGNHIPLVGKRRCAGSHDVKRRCTSWRDACAHRLGDNGRRSVSRRYR